MAAAFDALTDFLNSGSIVSMLSLIYTTVAISLHECGVRLRPVGMRPEVAVDSPPASNSTQFNSH